MTTEETKCKILQVFGYTPEDLNCADADTAMGEIFEQDSFTDPMSMGTQNLYAFGYNA
jgi:hypothetical protein